jgi:outer membrane protein insertion porin family
LGNIGIRERNLLGRGQDLRLNFTISGVDSQVYLSFTEPYFLDRNLSAGFDLFRTETNKRRRAYDLERIGGSLRTGFSYNEHLRQVVRYNLEQNTISNVDSGASLLIKGEEGTFLVSGFSQELSYDTRDNRIDPRKGMILRLRNEVAGAGGDVRFLKSSVGGSYHYSFIENWTASVDAEIGNIIGLGQDTRISDRNFVGGSNCRGFKSAGVGPHDAPTGDPLGAKQYYTGTLELGFPLGLPDEFNIRGRVFSDVCSAWGLDKSNSDVRDSQKPRASVGVGLSWQSPFGPIIVDLGYAVLKENFDETELFSFSFGTQF